MNLLLIARKVSSLKMKASHGACLKDFITQAEIATKHFEG